MKKKQYPNSPMVTLDICDHLEELVTVLWPTSKGTKNAVACANILRHIRDQLDGEFPDDNEYWINYHEIGPKSAPLIIYCTTGESVDCPVDVWVFRYCKKLGYSMVATNPDMMNYLLSHWFPVDLGIPFNDALGSIGQCTKDEELIKFMWEAAKDPEFPAMAGILQRLLAEEESTKVSKKKSTTTSRKRKQEKKESKESMQEDSEGLRRSPRRRLHPWVSKED